MEHYPPYPAPSLYPLIISTLALMVSAASFIWQHIRTKDAAICTLVGANQEPNRKSALFQFSIGNLGTRSLLLNGCRVRIFFDSALRGKYMDMSVSKNQLPQVLKSGEMTALIVESPWSDSFIADAEKFLAEKGEKGAKLYFVASPYLWNPKGRQLSASQLVATYETIVSSGSKFEMMIGQTFSLK